jgi:flagellar hook-associated protein 2
VGSTPIFTGSSSYSKDLQNVIARAVSIASLPLTQLDGDKTSLTEQSGELTTINTKVTAVQAAIDDIGDALDSSFDTIISDPTALDASTGPGAVEGSYSILVKDAGAYSTMMTRTWVDPAGAPKTYTLWIGATSYNVSGESNSAAAVASAINKSYNDKVHATVVNVGPAATPDYRISLQSVALTTELLDLRDGATLAEQQTAGRQAQYEVNRSGITVTTDSRSVSITDGVTLSLKKASTTVVDLTITRSTSALNVALTAFVSAYNGVVTELDAQRGLGTGPLEGNPLISQLSSALSGMATFANTGAFSGLRDMGVELQKNGKLTQNQFLLMAADLKNSAGVTSFFGSFKTTAGDILKNLQNATTGLLTKAQADYQTQITAVTKKIDEKQTRIDELQVRLQDQMAAADALLSSMEQQYSYMYNMFSAMQAASQQYK